MKLNIQWKKVLYGIILIVIGIGNNPMVGATVAVAVAVESAMNK